MTNATEIRLQRKQTSAYIDADPSEIALQRLTLVPNNAGGVKHGSIQSLAVQRVRLIDQQATRQRTMPDGEVVQVSYVMQGAWDLDVEVGDYFYLNGHKYEIIQVSDKRAYQTLCEVYDRG